MANLRNVYYRVDNRKLHYPRPLFVFLVIMLSCSSITTVHAASIWYVSSTGTDLNNCLTLNTPCKTITSAIAKSSNGDTINIARGRYLENIVINKNITVNGAGTTADGTFIGAWIGFRISGSVVTITQHTNVNMSNVHIRGGTLYNSSGAGIKNDGNLTISDSIIVDNQVRGDIANLQGAGVYNTGTMKIVRSTVVANNVIGLSTDANPVEGGGISNQGFMSIYDSTITNNSADCAGSVSHCVGLGGGIASWTPGSSLAIESSSVSNNSADTGGGMWASSLSIERSTVNNNTAANEGGGIAIAGYHSSVTTIQNSTVNNNTAADGGGIVALFDSATARVSLVNSTVSGNIARGSSTSDLSGYGGGILTSSDPRDDFDSIIISSSTIVGNSAASGGGGIASVTIYAQNSIIAGNTSLLSRGPDCLLTVESRGYNLIGNSTDCVINHATGDLIGTPDRPIDPEVGPLQMNGGAAPTHALLDGSPAINAGNPASPGTTSAACPFTDERGVHRPTGKACDIGAYERGSTGYLPLILK